MIYLHHIRRTGGRSLIMGVLGNFGDPIRIYSHLPRYPFLMNDDQLIWGWNPRPPSRVFFGWSHQPIYCCALPSDTFTITILRDPIERVLSHYRLLRYAILENHYWGIPSEEKRWAEGNVDLFLDRIPREHLLRQIYMFSQSFSWKEARDRIQALSYWFFLSDFEQALTVLGNKLGLVLRFHHVEEGSGFTRAQVEQGLSQSTRDRLRTLVETEYELLEGLK